MTPAQTRGMEHVRSLIDGYQSTCVLMAAVNLGIFEKLAAQARDLPCLAEAVGADESALRRLLRALFVYGLVAPEGAEVALTESGRLFVEGSGAGEQVLLLREQYLGAWTRLHHSVRSGRPAFETVFEMSPWEHRRRNPDINAAFNSMVAGAHDAALGAILAAYDFSGFGSVADIGGGNGYLLAGILRKHTALMGVLFDQPHVLESAAGRLRHAGLEKRCRTESGSFFEHVPSGCDLYVLQYILHDWNDEDCISILRMCRRAMSRTGKLLLLEKTLPADDSSAPQGLVMRDLHMMAVLGGRERKLDEFDALLGAVAMRRTRYVPLPPHCPDIIEVEIAS